MSAHKTILFLDFDGCLNHAGTLTSRKERNCDTCHRLEVRDETCWFEPDCIERLNRVTQATGCAYVISSTWRLGRSVEQLRAILSGHGFTGEIIGCTPYGSKGPNGYRRGYEIQEWLDKHGLACDVEKFAIVDDDSDMEHLMDRFVKTSWDTGIQDEHVEALIKLLGSRSV